MNQAYNYYKRSFDCLKRITTISIHQQCMIRVYHLLTPSKPILLVLEFFFISLNLYGARLKNIVKSKEKFTFKLYKLTV